jgi:hypothetical protein
VKRERSNVVSKKSAVAHLHPLPAPADDQMVAVLLPASWMRKVDVSLEQLGQLLRSGDRRIGPQPAANPSSGESEADDEFIDAKKAAALTSYHAKTIRRWKRAGKLKGYGPGGHRIKKSELYELMASLAKSETPEDIALAEAAARLHEGEED